MWFAWNNIQLLFKFLSVKMRIFETASVLPNVFSKHWREENTIFFNLANLMQKSIVFLEVSECECNVIQLKLDENWMAFVLKFLLLFFVLKKRKWKRAIILIQYNGQDNIKNAFELKYDHVVRKYMYRWAIVWVGITHFRAYLLFFISILQWKSNSVGEIMLCCSNKNSSEQTKEKTIKDDIRYLQKLIEQFRVSPTKKFGHATF